MDRFGSWLDLGSLEKAFVQEVMACALLQATMVCLIKSARVRIPMAHSNHVIWDIFAQLSFGKPTVLYHAANRILSCLHHTILAAVLQDQQKGCFYTVHSRNLCRGCAFLVGYHMQLLFFPHFYLSLIFTILHLKLASSCKGTASLPGDEV